MQKILFTSMLTSRDEAEKLAYPLLKNYGMDIDIHSWKTFPKEFAWAEVLEIIVTGKYGMWVPILSREALDDPVYCYMLSAALLGIKSAMGNDFAVALVGLIPENTLKKPLAFLLRSLPFFEVGLATLGPKLIALYHKKNKRINESYRLGLHGNGQIGQWFEVGPVGETWNGIIFGVCEGNEILFQAVGPAGRLPEKSILNYPMQGMKITLGDKKYIAWAVKNELGNDNSCYIKVTGEPESIVFSPFMDEDEIEMYQIFMV